MVQTDYRALCRDVGDWVAGVASLSTVDALVDIAELTVAHPAGDAGARSGLWASIVASLQPFERRLDPVQVAVIKDLDTIISAGAIAAAFGSLEASGEQVVMPDLRGRVAVYTLVESVARRVKEAIEAVAPDVRVDYATDKVGNDATTGARARGGRLRRLTGVAPSTLPRTSSATTAAVAECSSPPVPARPQLPGRS